MSEEEKIFVRTKTNANSSHLHSFGGQQQEAHDELHTEREDLEDAIERLNESEESENLVSIAEQMNGTEDLITDESTNDVEEVAERKTIQITDIPSEPVAEPEPEPEPEPTPAPTPAPAPKPEPINSWHKADVEPTIEPVAPAVDEPNPIEPTTAAPAKEKPAKKEKKCGSGWRAFSLFITFLFFATLCAGAYIIMTDNKFEFADRTIETYKTGSKKTAPVTPSTPTTPDTPKDEDGLVINGAGFKLKNINAEKYRVSYRYNAGDTNATDIKKYPSVSFWLSMKSYDKLPDFANESKNTSSMGVIYIVEADSFEDQTYNSFELKPGTFLVYEYPNAHYSTTESDIEKETECNKALQSEILLGTNIEAM